MSAKMNVVQVGVGNFGEARRNFMRETGLFKLVACYDISAEMMARAEAEDGARPTGSYAELLDTPDIEAVIVSTGGKFHAEQVQQAADRGLHVFVEKPLCATAAEVDIILDAGRRNDVVIGCGHHDHSSEAVSKTIKGMLDDGAFGKVAAFEATTCHSGSWHIKPGDWRGDPAKNPGGMLFQCGVHKIHELLFYFGPIRSVFAGMRYDVNEGTGTADAALCQLFFESGLIGSLNAYHVSPYRHTLSIFGSKLNLYRDSRFFHEGERIVTQTSDWDNTYEPHEPLVIEGDNEANGNLRSFYAAVREGGTCYPSALDGARAVEVVFAAEESARTGCRVDVRQL